MEPTRRAASAASETCLTILLGIGGYEDQSEYNGKMRIRGYMQGLGRGYFHFLQKRVSVSVSGFMRRWNKNSGEQSESSREATLKFNWSVTAQYAGMSSLHLTMLGNDITASEQELTISWLGERFYSIPSNSWPSWLQPSLIKTLGSPAIKCFRNAPKWDRINRLFHQVLVFVTSLLWKWIIFAAFAIKRWKWFCPINT